MIFSNNLITNNVIGKNHRFLRCSLCNFKVHIKCTKLRKTFLMKFKRALRKKLFVLNVRKKISLFLASIKLMNQLNHMMNYYYHQVA